MECWTLQSKGRQVQQLKDVTVAKHTEPAAGRLQLRADGLFRICGSASSVLKPVSSVSSAFSVSSTEPFSSFSGVVPSWGGVAFVPEAVPFALDLAEALLLTDALDLADDLPLADALDNALVLVAGALDLADALAFEGTLAWGDGLLSVLATDFESCTCSSSELNASTGRNTLIDRLT